MEEKKAADFKQGTKKNGIRKVIIFLVLGLFVLGAAAAGVWWWRDLQTSISTDDARVGGDIVDISSKISGRLEKIYVTEGDVVKPGQKLAELDNAQYSIAVAQAQASLNLAKANYNKLPDDIKSARAGFDKSQQTLLSSQANLKSAEIAFADAKRNLDQNEALYASGAVSKEQLDSARSRFDTAKAALEAAQANVLFAQAGLRDSEAKWESVKNTSAEIYLAQIKQAQANYDNAKLAYDNSFIYATGNGTVVRVPAKVGENISPGQTILTITDLQGTWIDANIEENKFGRVQVGQKVDVKVDAYPGKVFAGKVIQVGGATQATFALIPSESSSGNFTKVTQKLPVKISVDKKGLLFKPGMSAEIKIYTT